jgi:hypothetical protein
MPHQSLKTTGGSNVRNPAKRQLPVRRGGLYKREGDEKVVPAFIAKGPGKAVGEDTVREILAKIMFHLGLPFTRK